MSEQRCNHCNSLYEDDNHIKECEYHKLKNALHSYATHKSNCRSWWIVTRAESITRGECSCGLEQLLKLYSQ